MRWAVDNVAAAEPVELPVRRASHPAGERSPAARHAPHAAARAAHRALPAWATRSALANSSMSRSASTPARVAASRSPTASARTATAPATRSPTGMSLELTLTPCNLPTGCDQNPLAYGVRNSLRDTVAVLPKLGP